MRVNLICLTSLIFFKSPLWPVFFAQELYSVERYEVIQFVCY